MLLVYGTLRPGKSETVKVPGQLFDLGWFPGIKLGWPGEVVCEPIEIDDWGPVDRYEGYDPTDPGNSLYIRRQLVDISDGLNGFFIYEYNHDINPVKLIQTGDWLDYTAQERGKYGERFGKSVTGL